MKDSLVTALIEREMAKPGLRGRINAKCVDCIYDPFSGGGNWRQQVTACTATACPLYDARPQTAPGRPFREPSRAERGLRND